MSEKFKVVTTDGVTVNKGSDKTATGLDEKFAKADAERRNEKAADLGIKARYEVRPF